MRWLIDGYNVMHAGGRIHPGQKGESFRRARRRFLDELSDALGADRARETTVVFDASVPPGDLAVDAGYRGMRVRFALGDENADARIEQLIAEHRTLRRSQSFHPTAESARRPRAAVPGR